MLDPEGNTTLVCDCIQCTFTILYNVYLFSLSSF